MKTFAGAICAVAALTTIATAAEAAESFAGKRITISVGFEPGSGYDASGRLLARHMARHLAGEPTFIVRNMPGASSIRLTNYMYGLAPRDGTEMAVVNQGLPMSQALNEKGVEFDARDFAFVGSPESSVNVAFSWHTSPVKTIQDAMEKELVIGASNAGSATVFYPLMMNELLGTKFKIIRGYPSPDLMLAIERGEVQGRGALTWTSLSSTDWVSGKKVNILVQMGAKKSPDLPDVPLMSDLAKNPDDKRLLEFISAAPSVGRPFLLPPKVPAGVVDTLRRAFDATMKDEKFLAEANTAKFSIDPLSGEELTKVIMSILDAPKDIVAKTEVYMTK